MLIENYFEKVFIDNESNILKNLPEHIANIKRNAIKSFLKEKLPSTDQENWRYTNLRNVISPEYKINTIRPEFDFKIQDIFKCDVPDLKTDVFITINGWYNDYNQPILHYQNGIIIGSFAMALEKYPQIVLKYYTKIAEKYNYSLINLNTAFANDGMFIYIPENVNIEKPIQIIDIVTGNDDLIVQRRNLFILENNSFANIVICDHSLTFNKSYTNSVTEIFAGTNSKINLTRLQNSSNNTAKTTNVVVTQKEKSKVNINTITLHGGFVRNNIFIDLCEQHSENNLYGIYLCDREQFIDNYTFVNHLAPECMSNQKYKGIMDDKSHAVFFGKILVNREAQKTQAYQANNNLLLTDDAKINTKPHLEIYADDVKCSHGATIGQLDEEAMFYLMARGISQNEAKMMLMQAFANEIIQKITIPPLVERITDLVNKRLRGELSRCNHCVINCC